MNFSKFHEFIFFKSRFSAINRVFPFIFHTKMAILDTYFEIATIYIRNTMNITSSKIKKKFTEPIFQTATSSGLLKYSVVGICHKKDNLHFPTLSEFCVKTVHVPVNMIYEAEIKSERLSF